MTGGSIPFDEGYRPRLAPGEHEPACLEVRKRHDEWVAMWPKFCRACGGTGAYYIPARIYRDGSADPPDSGPCASCAEDGVCPRCGFRGLDEDGNECSICGWAYDCDDGVPPKCICAEW